MSRHSHIIKTNIPSQSCCREYLTSIDYSDAFAVTEVDTHLTIQEIYHKIFSDTPLWIKRLMKMRNRLVAMVGLKTNIKHREEGQSQIVLSDSSVGFFEIYHIGEEEVVAGEKDKHLDFVVSVLREKDKVTISTLVQYNNTFGRLYMLVISPIHKIIVKRMIRRLI